MKKYLCYNISEITYCDAIYGKWFKSLLNRKKYYLISRDQDIKSYRPFGYDGDTNIINSLDIYCNNTTLSYTYTYDSGTNSLVKCTKGSKDIEYEYNPLGQRSRKVVNDEVTDYIYEDNKLIEEITSTHSMKYLYNTEGIYGFIKKTGTTCSYYYYIKNLIGEIIGIINNSGNMVVNYEYDPWGKLLSITGSQATTIGSQNHILYKGYYYDVETGLFMMGHRYYSPELCRFIQPDDIEYLDPSSINGLNLYCYCMNNPIMYFDPSGHMPEWAMWVIGGVLLVGSIALTIATGGAAAGTVLATVHTIATGAMIGGITSAAISTIAGGISYENGVASWDWSGAAKGFMWGSITGVISGAAGSALSNVGSGLAAYGKLGKLGYAGIQGLINSGIAGGAIGITKWGEGIRNIIVGAGLGLGECSIGEIIEWWQSRQRTNMAYLRFAY